MSKKDRNARILIKEAELVNGSNDYIYNFYVNYSKTLEKIDVEDIDEETEQKLLNKNDPFIDVVLAQYCFYHQTLKQLFSKSFVTNDMTIRLACLSNKSIGKKRWSIYELPQALFDSENNDGMLNWFSSITHQEVDTLFRNDTIDDGFLTSFLELENDLWKALTEDNKLQVIVSLYYNERVCKKYEGPMDGYAEYLHGRLFSVIWDLAKKLPVEKKWAYALGNLLDKTSDDRYEFDSLEVAKRWNVEEEEDDKTKKQFLDCFELVRYAIYKNVVKNLYGKDKTNKLHYQHEDLAYRACAYVQTDMTEDDIREAYAKDKLVAIEFIMRNMRVWRNDDLRDVLKDICWDADSTINSNYLDCANMFNYKQEELEEKYPDWFAEKEDEAVIDDDDKALSLRMARELIQEFKDDIVNSILIWSNSYGKQIMTIRWIFYGVIVLALILLLR